MNRQDYLAETYVMLNGLMGDRVFQNHVAQVRAHAIHAELSEDPHAVTFTYSPQRIEKDCGFISLTGGRLLTESTVNVSEVSRWIELSARTLEFLARTSPQGHGELLLLHSAISYHLAGYQANAQCIVSLAERSYQYGLPAGNGLGAEDNPPDTILDRYLVDAFRSALIYFLKPNIAELRQITARASSWLQQSQSDIVSSVLQTAQTNTELFTVIAHAFFHEALSGYVQYCYEGAPSKFAICLEGMRKCRRYFDMAREATFESLVSGVEHVLATSQSRSTWDTIRRYAPDLLADPVWQTYLRNLALDKSIVAFWPSQLRAINAGLLTSNDSFVVQMPTSAGKTLIAELAILSVLSARENARCLYIAPYRALATEIENSMAQTLAGVGYRVSSLIGGFELDAFQDFLANKSDVLVATPEKVELALRTHPEYFANLSVVVVDEGHIVDEGIPQPDELESVQTLAEKLEQQGTLGRGPLLELLVTRLKLKFPAVRFLYLSAVMPDANAGDFVRWLSKQHQPPLKIDQLERPSRLLMAKFEWKSKQNGEMEYIGLPSLPEGRHPFVSRFLRVQQYLTGRETPTGRPQRKSWPAVTNKAQTTAMIAIELAKTGPVLVFCAQPHHVRQVVENIIESLEYLQASDALPIDTLRFTTQPNLESFQLSRQWLGYDHLLTRALHHRVGLHYGPLPDPVREVVEDEFRTGKLRILVSTNTLGQGVNMPVKSVVIYSLVRRWGKGEGGFSKVKIRDFWNVCGRAGRASKETEGQVVFVVTSPSDRNLLGEYQDPTNVESVESALYKLLLALVERRISDQDLVSYLDSHLLALMAEEVVDTQDEGILSEFLGSSLVGVQAHKEGVSLTPLATAFRRAATWIKEQVPDPGLRAVFATTGFGVMSCQVIEQVADRFIGAMNPDLLQIERDITRYNPELLYAAFEACSNLTEMTLDRRVSYAGPANEITLVEGWVNGTPIDQLRSTAWRSEDNESFSEYMADRIVYKLPWGVHSFLRILAYKLQTKYEQMPIVWQHLPSMVKFGLGNLFACWAASLCGISRELAVQLGGLYEPQGSRSFPAFVRWAVSLPTEFILQELGASDYEKLRLIKNLNRLLPDRERLEFIRTQSSELISPVQGIPYANRADAASRVRQGAPLLLEPEPDNPFDVYAVRVLFEDQHIGYVQRDKAKIVSQEMQLGVKPLARARSIRPATADHPYPRIEAVISFQ